jgi:hypothetical protein
MPGKEFFMSITIEIETSDGAKLPPLTTAQAMDVYSQLAELLGQNHPAPLLATADWLKPPYRITTDLPLRTSTPLPVPIIVTCGDPPNTYSTGAASSRSMATQPDSVTLIGS